MWISKKKYENDLRKVKSEAALESLDREAEFKKWEELEKLKKEVKKLKKQIREGY